MTNQLKYLPLAANIMKFIYRIWSGISLAGDVFYTFLQRQMIRLWWKILVVVFILYTLVAGLLLGVP
jgi:heme exporter protein C